MHANHEVLWRLVVGAAWLLGYVAAPVWMPITAAALVAVSLWLDLRAEVVRIQGGPMPERATINAIRRCSTQTGIVLTAYLGGLALSRVFS